MQQQTEKQNDVYDGLGVWPFDLEMVSRVGNMKDNEWFLCHTVRSHDEHHYTDAGKLMKREVNLMTKLMKRSSSSLH